MNNIQSDDWTRILNALQAKVSQNSFLTWFMPLKFLRQQDDIITVGVPNQFFYGFLDSHYRDQIQMAVREATQDRLQLKYEILEGNEEHRAEETPLPAADYTESNGGFDKRTQLNPRYTLENFVEGEGNRFAKAAALAVAEAPGKTPFNPLFVYGASGLGKTHLIQAVGNFSLAHNRSLRAIYITSEKFVSDFIFSIKTYKTTDFSRFYRSVDLLLLDDIQFLRGKERTQMEFFHTFNTLHQTGKQIVLSSDRPPKELDDFDTRLTSRIGSGLVTDIQAPDYETRLAILQRRSETEGFPIPEDVAQYLASVITDNIRALEGALIRLMAHCSIIGQDITVSVAQKVLQEFIPPPKENLSLKSIQEAVTIYFKLQPDILLTRNRRKEIAWARQVAMYLSLELTGASLQAIGDYYKRDHSTVIHARNLVTQTLARDAEIRQAINQLKSELSTT
jgi:chromosomal replication initiator protein